MRYRILGPLEVSDSAGVELLRSDKAAALLAILLLRANELVPVGQLVEDLWGARPPATAVHLVHVYVSQVRKMLGDESRALTTRAPGYVLAVDADQLDAFEFDRLRGEAQEAWGAGDAVAAEQLASAALALWRGRVLSNFVYEPFVQRASARLEELRLLTVELRLDVLLTLGRHREAVVELEALVGEHPQREELARLLMMALYRSERQADALAVYRRLQITLDEELGLSPAKRLRELEAAILRHDPALDLDGRHPAPSVSSEPVERSVLVYVRDERNLKVLVDLVEPLARRLQRPVLLVSMPPTGNDVSRMTTVLRERSEALVERGVPARAAALTSPSAGDEVARLSARYGVDLVITDVDRGSAWPNDAGELEALLEAVATDVAVVVPGSREPSEDAVFVLFGGVEEEWAAVELAGWIAASARVPLRILGTAAEPDRRDASGLLAHASLVVQKVVGLVAEPVLVSRDVGSVTAVTDDARLLVMSLSAGRLHLLPESFGAQILVASESPVLLVRGGVTPSALFPAESLTAFGWTVVDGKEA